MAKKIVVIPGDGIGKEITESAVEVLKKVDQKFNIGMEYEFHDAGGTAYDKYGVPLPEETVTAAKASDGVLFGAVGGDKWDSLKPELRPEKAILGLRKALFKEIMKTFLENEEINTLIEINDVEQQMKALDFLSGL